MADDATTNPWMTIFQQTIAAVQAVEAAAPAGTKGADKLKVVTAQIQAWAPIVGIGIEWLGAIGPMISTFASGVVAHFNAIGLFKTATPQPAPDATQKAIAAALAPHIAAASIAASGATPNLGQGS